MDLILTCRLCLTKYDNLIDIFGEQGLKQNIANILSKHFWFEVLENHNYSRKICPTCWMKVESFHLFYVKIQNQHKIKSQSDLNLEDQLENDYHDQHLSTKQIIKVEKRDNSNSDNSNENFDNEDLNSVQQVEIDSKYDISSRTRSKKKERLISTTEKIESNDMKIIKIENSSSDPCNLLIECSNDIHPSNNLLSKTDKLAKRNNPQTLKEDQQIRDFCKMECEICSTKFYRFYDVKTHYRTDHNVNGYIYCCNKKFFKRVRVLEHIMRHLNPEVFKCELCNKIYADKPGLLNHLDSHAPPEKRPYKCDKCSKSYAKRFQLEQHKVRHISDDNKKFVCDECGRAFAVNSMLQTHKRNVHENANSHMCDICAKVFKSKMFFQKHQIEHLDVKIPKVQCQTCGKWLKHESSLRSHMVRHEDANSEHICNICGKKAPTRGALLGHKKYVHLIEKKHKCSVCEKAFKKAISLKEHMTLHTGEVLYMCQYCPKTFNSAANMHSHKKRIHTKEWLEEKRLKELSN